MLVLSNYGHNGANNANERRDNNNNNRTPQSGEARNKISLKRVAELLEKEADTILLTLNDKKFGFEDYMSTQTMGNNLIRLVLQLLVKGFECHAIETQKHKIIEQLVNSNFLNELVYKSIEDSRDRFGVYDLQLIKSVMNVCNFILRVNPARLTALEKIIERTELVVKLRVRDIDLMNEFESKIGRLLVDIEEQKKQNTRAKPIKQNPELLLTSHEFLEPPERLEMIPILPTLQEVTTNQKPFLRKNIIVGAYRNVEHYLDIHFRLLREDFLQPLRQGINEFKSILSDHKRKTPNIELSTVIESAECIKKIAHIDGLRAYFNVSFKTNLCSDNGVTFSLQLDIEKCKNVKWEFSKRLLFGSLICLSNDFFKDNFILAVICERDVEALKKGVIKVRLEEEKESLIDKAFLLDGKMKYIMFETTAYFEAYRHVLHALRSLRTEDFPFKEHIIDCKNEDIGPPEYLTNSYIDLRTLVDTKMKPRVNYGTGETKYDFDQSVNYAMNCHINDERRWPSPNQMNLDLSQYEAIKSALQRKIALIQG